GRRLLGCLCRLLSESALLLILTAVLLWIARTLLHLSVPGLTLGGLLSRVLLRGALAVLEISFVLAHFCHQAGERVFHFVHQARIVLRAVVLGRLFCRL